MALGEGPRRYGQLQKRIGGIRPTSSCAPRSPTGRAPIGALGGAPIRGTRIGILGAGRMASALAPHWRKAGHPLMIGGRDAAGARELATGIGARSGMLADVAGFAEAVLLAVRRSSSGWPTDTPPTASSARGRRQRADARRAGVIGGAPDGGSTGERVPSSAHRRPRRPAVQSVRRRPAADRGARAPCRRRR
jgi:hypothetical protein